MKTILMQIGGRIVVPLWFLCWSLVSIIRPRAGAQFIKDARETRHRRGELV